MILRRFPFLEVDGSNFYLFVKCVRLRLPGFDMITENAIIAASKDIETADMEGAAVLLDMNTGFYCVWRTTSLGRGYVSSVLL